MDIHKKYSLVKDHDKHFEIHDSTDGKRFSVAKKDLHPATQIKLMKMPKFSAGGEVPERPGYHDLPGPYQEDPPPEDGQEGIAKKQKMPSNKNSLPKFANGGEAPPSISVDNPAAQLTDVPTSLTPTDAPSQFQPVPGQMAEAYPGESAQAVQNAQNTPMWDPSKGLRRDAFTNPNSQQIVLPQATKDIDPSQLDIHTDGPSGPQPYDPNNIMGEYNRAFGLENKANQENFNAHSGLAQEQEKIFRQQHEDLANIAADHDRKLNDMNQTSDRLFGNLMNGKVDPEQYWKTHSKIGAGLGMLLSGIGSGLSGQRNLAMDVINRGIDADIDAQKSNMNQQNNLFKMNMERSHNEQEAYARTKSDLLTIAQAKLNQMAAKMGTPAAMAARDAANANILKQKAQLHASVAGMGVARQAYTTGIPPEAVSLLPEKQREQMVRLPNGYMADSGSAANAKEYNEQTAAYVPLMSDLKELNTLNTLGSRMDPAQRARAHELIGHTVVSLNDLAKSHRISESDIGFQSGQLSDPTAMSTLLSGNAATNQLMKSLTRKMDAIGQQYVPAIGNMQRKQSQALSGFRASK